MKIRALAVFAAGIGGFAVLSMTAAGRADTVSYYTIGTFTAISGDTLGGGTTNEVIVNSAAPGGTSTITLTNGAKTAQLSFTSAVVTNFTVNGPGAVFGSFQLTNTNATPPADFDDSFTLQIVQTAPPGTGTLTDEVTGVIHNGANNSLSVTFDPTNVVYIPDPATGYKYTVPDFGVGPVSSTGSLGPITLSGSVATPLPATAKAGFSLFGLLALVSAAVAFGRRRQQPSVVA